MKIYGKTIFLRTVEMSDCQLLLDWENNIDNWDVSDTTTPFTKEEIIHFIQEQQTILSTGQIRFIICLIEEELPIGAIDLFAIDKTMKSAGVGILINDKQYRSKGYAKESLDLLKNSAKNTFHLKTLYCNIQSNNLPSIHLFTQANFVKSEQQNTQKILHFNCQL